MGSNGVSFLSGHCEMGKTREDAHLFCSPALEAAIRCRCPCHPSLETDLLRRLTETTLCLHSQLTDTPHGPDIDSINELTKEARKLAILLSKSVA